MTTYLDVDPSDYTTAEADQQVQCEETTKARQWCIERGFEPPITLAALKEKYLRFYFLVERCLVRNQPMTISAASKGMKTTVSIQLALALASGKPFLGQFQINEQCNVLLASAESGAATIRRNVFGMAKAMGIDVDELAAENRLSFQWWVPRTDNEDLVKHLIAGIIEQQAKVCILDPMYLMLNGESASNLSMHGDQIMTLMKRIIDAGCTPIVDDHVKRASQNAKDYQPLELNDITGAGKAEAFRQWILLGRRSRFENVNDSLELRHDLWATIGGSAGFSATWGVDIVETFAPDYSAISYTFDVRKAGDVIEEIKESRTDARQSHAERKQKIANDLFASKCDRVAQAIKAKPDQPFTRTDIRAIARANSDKANEIIFELETTKRIQKHATGVKRGNNTCEAWQAVGPTVLDFGTDDINAGQVEKP